MKRLMLAAVAALMWSAVQADERRVLTRTPAVDDDWLTMQAFAEALRPHLDGEAGGCVHGFVSIDGWVEDADGARGARARYHLAVREITKVGGADPWTRVTVRTSNDGRRHLLVRDSIPALLARMRCRP